MMDMGYRLIRTAKNLFLLSFQFLELQVFHMRLLPATLKYTEYFAYLVALCWFYKYIGNHVKNNNKSPFEN